MKRMLPGRGTPKGRQREKEQGVLIVGKKGHFARECQKPKGYGKGKGTNNAPWGLW